MRVKIVVPGDQPPQIQDSPQLARLHARGEVVVHRDRPRSVAEQLERVRDATCILNSRGAVKWRGELLRQLPQLKMITVCGIGTDSIDLVVARERGIAVSNIPGKTAPIVAEHALALMFAVARRTWFHTDALKRGSWSGLETCMFFEQGF